MKEGKGGVGLMAVDDGTIKGACQDESKNWELWISECASIRQLHRYLLGINR